MENKIQNTERQSFTLIELLVVLALVAILSVVVVMTLNPAELIKQARDSNRLSDLATINTALNLFSADVTSGFMGTSTMVYVSIPDTSPTCANLGLPTSTGYTYNCVTRANLRNTDGTGWIPVNFQRISSNSPISQLPIDPTNTTSTNLYYTYVTGGSWKLSTMLEAQKNLSVANLDGGTAPAAFEMGNNLTLGQTVFPNGWIKVPGNSTFGTSDFWVMKYEAKCADSTGPLESATYDGGYKTYSNTGYPCNASGRNIASTAGGYPIAYIGQTTSATYCQNIGAHLITNNEWQTISWNIQNVAANWSGAAVGSGSVYIGNRGGPNYGLTAPLDDLNGYYGTGQTAGVMKRTQILSNGQVIWDLANNLAEWASDTITGTNQPYSGTAGWSYRAFSAITNWGALTQQTAGPVNLSWGTAQGVGYMYSWDGTANPTVYGFVRGGPWDGGYGSSGIASIGLNQIPSAQYRTVGFRCAK